MAITKIQSESVNLADDFAFTGTVSGAGESNTPYWYATANGQSIPNSTTTLVAYSTEVLDSDGAYTNTASNYKFTVPSGKNGIYHIGAQIALNSGNDFNSCLIEIRKNNSIIATLNARHEHYEGRFTSIVTSAVATDYFTVTAYQDEGGAIALNNATLNFFYGYRVKST